MVFGDSAKKSFSKTKLTDALCVRNQPVRFNQVLYTMNFHFHIIKIIEFLETDVRKLSGTWEETDGKNGFVLKAKIDIEELKEKLI